MIVVKSGLFNIGYKFVVNIKKLGNEAYVPLVFAILSAIFFTGIFSDAKTVFLLYFVFTVILNHRLKNFPFSLFVMSLFILPFFEPNKYYVVEVLKSYERVPDINLGFKDGYFLGYGLIISNIFVFLSLGGIVREVILKKTRLKIPLYIKVVILSAVLYFSVALYSSLTHSFAPELSVTWLTQYMQMFIIAILVWYFYVTQKGNFKVFYSAILSSTLFQIFIALLQFFKQSSVGIAVEYGKVTSAYLSGLDEVDTLLRPFGTLVQPNQLAVVLLGLFVLLLPLSFSKRKNQYFIVLAGALAVIVLTQSRAIWIATVFTILVAYKYYYQDLKYYINFIGIRRLFYYGFLLSLPLLWVLIPRISLSVNTTEEGAGLPIRLKMYSEGWEAFSANPFMGYGVGTNEYVLHSLFPDGVISVFPAAVHLGYLQFLLESGIIGLALFVFPFFYVTRILKSNIDKGMLFRFFGGMTVYGIYYLFHPYAGIIEFPYLGLHLGFGLISVYLLKNKS